MPTPDAAAAPRPPGAAVRVSLRAGTLSVGIDRAQLDRWTTDWGTHDQVARALGDVTLGAMTLHTPGGPCTVEHRDVRRQGDTLWADATVACPDDGPRTLEASYAQGGPADVVTHVDVDGVAIGALSWDSPSVVVPAVPAASEVARQHVASGLAAGPSIEGALFVAGTAMLGRRHPLAAPAAAFFMGHLGGTVLLAGLQAPPTAVLAIQAALGWWLVWLGVSLQRGATSGAATLGAAVGGALVGARLGAGVPPDAGLATWPTLAFLARWTAAFASVSALGMLLARLTDLAAMRLKLSLERAAGFLLTAVGVSAMLVPLWLALHGSP